MSALSNQKKHSGKMKSRIKRRTLPQCSYCGEAEWFVLVFEDGQFVRVCPVICGLETANRIAFSSPEVISTWQAISFLEKDGRIGEDITSENEDLVFDIQRFTKLSVAKQGEAMRAIGGILQSAEAKSIGEIAKQLHDKGDADPRLCSFIASQH